MLYTQFYALNHSIHKYADEREVLAAVDVPVQSEYILQNRGVFFWSEQMKLLHRGRLPLSHRNQNEKERQK